ncbi:hypothetical protein DPMN_119211 [Dreissena polymorpha]|uniref:Uncharacterized protein n=1 Tax=Dreissena polymorpha TaxID=45954 RepID=A0A9D4JMH7_DREPO|nr:hypothetical protein DPMN_119211 [Dreissena polymorpha]
MSSQLLLDIRQKSRILNWGECRASSDIDIRYSPEYRTSANVKPALTSTFGKSPKYRAGAYVEQALILTFRSSPEYRAGAKIEPAVTSTFGKKHEYRAGTIVEPALTLTFGKSPKYRAEYSPSSVFGTFAKCRCQSCLDIRPCSIFWTFA